jgi:tetratricopeptide (TPR) repeat protein
MSHEALRRSDEVVGWGTQMLKFTIAAIAISIASAAIAQDQPRDGENRTLNELSWEMLECSTYFLISAQCIESHPDPSAPRTTSDLRQAAEKIGTLAITTGRAAGVTDEGVAERTKLTFQKLMKSINNNCVNIAVLLDRYNNFCKQLSQEPDKRLKELLATDDDRATCLKMSGDVAIAACSRAITSNGHDVGWFYGKRGIEYGKKGEYDRAIQEFDEAIRLDPTVALFLNHRGDTFRDKGDYDRAFRDYDEAIRLDPNDALSFIHRGRAFQQKGDHGRAIQDFADAIRLDPKNAFAFNDRGRAFLSKGDYDRAMQDFDEAIRLDPKNTLYFNTRGDAFLSKGIYDRAMQDFDEAIRLDPTMRSHSQCAATLLSERVIMTALSETSTKRSGSITTGSILTTTVRFSVGELPIQERANSIVPLKTLRSLCI